ncbi:hypothetical protein HanXRQr2_Chr03g0120631 [Helianthus annuus]|uniref:Uncharacterized protein n=1 Tax=Helianthus annuus TaxID=4232 RepID=A0A9K3JHB9_HELAN|nr:hypothetical protein HanXRQr2_Chr03g0120631 [Helianthus annuus]KAJ0944472.1 hypothetical protein HanPSC8_Chr03g0117161 [Helianthus annuus]
MNFFQWTKIRNLCIPFLIQKDVGTFDVWMDYSMLGVLWIMKIV